MGQVLVTGSLVPKQALSPGHTQIHLPKPPAHSQAPAQPSQVSETGVEGTHCPSTPYLVRLPQAASALEVVSTETTIPPPPRVS